MAKYTLMKTEGRAKRAQFETVHGTIQTPVFMNVGTIGAIKGAVSTQDLYEIGTQVELSNTYHLHVRPGDKIVKQLGGLHKFMNWHRPILTDSGSMALTVPQVPTGINAGVLTMPCLVCSFPSRDLLCFFKISNLSAIFISFFIC